MLFQLIKVSIPSNEKLARKYFENPECENWMRSIHFVSCIGPVSNGIRYTK